MPYYGARIRAARGYADLTQDQLADALGVDAATIKRREHPRGHEHLQSPKKGERLAIAQVCGVPLEFLEDGFEGRARDEVSERLDALHAQLADLRRELLVRGREASQQNGGDDQQVEESPPEPPQ